MTELQQAMRPLGVPARAGDGAWRFSWPLAIGVYVFLMTLYRGHIDNILLLDGDTYWHIATGQWILQHLAVPTADP
ncbi:MAG TPA: hypothetical protein VD970_15270, partial [Acetobacteraceae bacterium]|nr:hypothetical protein [Acetobacteraceae bacterium]